MFRLPAFAVFPVVVLLFSPPAADGQVDSDRLREMQYPVTPAPAQTPADSPLEQQANGGASAQSAVATTCSRIGSPPALGPVATVIIVEGEAWIERSGKRVGIARGSPVREGDELVTGAGASSHVRLSDGGQLALRESTRVRVSSYFFDPNSIEPACASLELQEGALRVLLGDIPLEEPLNFEVVAQLPSQRVVFNPASGRGDFEVAKDAGGETVFSGVFFGSVRLESDAGVFVTGENTGHDFAAVGQGFIQGLETMPAILAQ